MTTTPRTDAIDDSNIWSSPVPYAQLARALETELAASRAECERLREALQALVDLAPDIKVAAPLVSIAGAIMDQARAALRDDV